MIYKIETKGLFRQVTAKMGVKLKRWLCGFWRKIAYHIDGEFSLLKIEMWDGFSFEILYYENGNWSGSLLGFWWTSYQKGIDCLFLRQIYYRWKG